MNRKAIANGNGMWFDLDKAEAHKERTTWNGNNHISQATGSQWNHEAIYVTAGGKFVLNKWSNFSGTIETYVLIDKERAAEWFSSQDFEMDDIPVILLGDVKSLEI